MSIKKIKEFLETIDVGLSLGGKIALVFIFFGGIIVGGLASISDWLGSYGPVSYAFAGLFATVILAFIFWLIAVVRAKWVFTSIERTLLFEKKTVNPLEDIFKKQRINILDFRSPYGKINSGKTFVDCEIYGPANIFLGSRVDLRSFHLRSCDLVKLAKKPGVVHNCIVFEDCVFTNCVFYFITILASEEQALSLRDTLKGKAPAGKDAGNWITDLPEDKTTKKKKK